MKPHLFIFAMYNPFDGTNKLYQITAWTAIEAVKEGFEGDVNCSFYSSVEEAKDYYANADYLLSDVIMVKEVL